MANHEDKNRTLRPHRKRLWLKWKPAKRPRHMRDLPHGWTFLKLTGRTLWAHKKILAGITLIYAALNLVLVRGFSNIENVSALRDKVDSAFNGTVSGLSSAIGIFSYLSGAAASTQASGASGAYQVMLVVIFSLAIIWVLRQTAANRAATIKGAFYDGMQQLVPFCLVVAIMAIEVLPFAAGALGYNIIVGNGIAVEWYEKGVVIALFAALAIWSFRMIMTSFLALYIVTLPGIAPFQALRSAKQLIRFRRWTIVWKLVALGLVIIAVALIVMVPTILFAAAIASWVFYALTMCTLAIVHTYLYGLYRELIHYAP